MINKIGLKNIRVFNELKEFELKPATILTGTNNCGKSTLQKILFLISKSLSRGSDSTSIDELCFDNEVIGRIDDYSTNICHDSNDDQLTISFDVNMPADKFPYESLCFKLIYEPCKTNNKIHLVKIEVIHEDKMIFYFDKMPFNDMIAEYGMYNNDLKGEIFNDKYAWRLNPDIDITNFVNYIYNTHLNHKKDCVEDIQIRNIDRKLQRGEKLVKDELLAKEYHEKRGLSFNDARAKKLYENLELSHNLQKNRSESRVWDNNIGTLYIYTHREECFDMNVKLLFSSKLYQIVMEDGEFFSPLLDDDKLISLRDILVENGIYSAEEFAKSYDRFQADVIYYNTYIRDHEIDEQIKKKYGRLFSLQKILEFDEFFLNEDIDQDFVQDVLVPISKGEDKIAKILMSNEYKDLLGDVRLKEELKRLEQMSNKIQDSVFGIVKHLSDELQKYAENISFVFQDKHIERIYLNSDIKKENLVILNFGKKILNKDKSTLERLEFVNKWLVDLEIAEELVINPISMGQKVIGLGLSLRKRGKEYPIDENGLGVNLVLMLLIRIAVADINTTLVLEEPESNLHPAFQSKLAELIADAGYKFQLKYVIETHSEYLIRKFQYLVASPEHNLSNDNFSIYYLYHPYFIPQGKKQVEKLEIRQDGILKQDFGVGFFDENARLTMNLLKLQYQN